MTGIEVLSIFLRSSLEVYADLLVAPAKRSPNTVQLSLGSENADPVD